MASQMTMRTMSKQQFTIAFMIRNVKPFWEKAKADMLAYVESDPIPRLRRLS